MPSPSKLSCSEYAEAWSFFGSRSFGLLLRAALIASVAMVVIGLFLGATVIVQGCSFAACAFVGLLILIRVGFLCVAQLLSVIVLFLIAAFFLMNGNGVRDIAILLFPLILLFSSITLNRIFFWCVASVSILFLVGLGLAEAYGAWQTVYSHLPLGVDFCAVVVIMIVAAVFTDLLLTSTRGHIDALLESKFKIEKADRTKTQFLSMMSHELRTPLNPILGFSKILRDELEDKQQVDFAEHIHVSGQQMLGLVESMLEYAQYADGTVELVPAPEALCDICEELVGQAEPFAREKGLQFVLDCAHCQCHKKPEKTLVTVDRQRVVRIVGHLLLNAIRHTEEGSVSLLVDVVKEKRGEFLLCMVSDTGIGIPEDEQKAVFDPFTQLQNEQHRGADSGLGLGLAICRHLVMLMDGDITCESLPEKGTRFTVKIPLLEQFES